LCVRIYFCAHVFKGYSISMGGQSLFTLCSNNLEEHLSTKTMYITSLQVNCGLGRNTLFISLVFIDDLWMFLLEK
jgi:hypothetical protein